MENSNKSSQINIIWGTMYTMPKQNRYLAICVNLTQKMGEIFSLGPNVPQDIQIPSQRNQKSNAKIKFKLISEYQNQTRKVYDMRDQLPQLGPDKANLLHIYHEYHFVFKTYC